MTVNEKGYAKLNYSLDVHARRPDGYHDLTMVMGSVSLWDDVALTLRADGKIEAVWPSSPMPRTTASKRGSPSCSGSSARTAAA